MPSSSLFRRLRKKLIPTPPLQVLTSVSGQFDHVAIVAAPQEPQETGGYSFSQALEGWEGYLCLVCKDMMEAIFAVEVFSEHSSRGYEICSGTHHDSIDAIHAAAGESCGICLRLKDWLAIHPNSHAGTDTVFSFASWEAIFKGDDLLEIQVLTPEARSNPKLSSISINDELFFKLECVALPKGGRFLPSMMTSSDKMSLPLNQMQYTHTGGEVSMDLARQWLKICRQTHTLCNKPQEPHFPPPRLLDLRNSCVCLVEDIANLPSCDYVTLSHSWGNSVHTLRLTATNREALCQGIPEDSLPKTFKDAIFICRKLSFDWLWIDSLCIIQSDPNDTDDRQHRDDWHKHVKIMDHIYQNCSLNIAAAASENPDTGCFQYRRDELQYQTCFQPMPTYHYQEPGTFKRGPPEPRVIRHLIYSYGREYSNQILDYRGWVAQERLLSPRTIQWAEEQIYWECSEVPLASETFPIGLTLLIARRTIGRVAIPKNRIRGGLILCVTIRAAL
jgi:hypothetical protein